jgi:hypothetical protein
MKTKIKSHVTLVSVLAVVAMVVAGHVAIASNTGFKLNKAIVPRLGTSTGQIGFNWLSLPDFNPYGNFAGLCVQTGLVSTGLTRASIAKIDPLTGNATVANCGTAQSTLPSADLVEGGAVRVINAGAGAPTSIILVGSHDPAFRINVPAKGAGQIGVTWFGVPYNTTAVTKEDLCLQIGLTTTGINRGSIVTVNPVNGAASTANCGTASAVGQIPGPGEGVRLLNPTAISFVPAYF